MPTFVRLTDYKNSEEKEKGFGNTIENCLKGKLKCQHS